MNACRPLTQAVKILSDWRRPYSDITLHSVEAALKKSPVGTGPKVCGLLKHLHTVFKGVLSNSAFPVAALLKSGLENIHCLPMRDGDFRFTGLNDKLGSVVVLVKFNGSDTRTIEGVKSITFGSLTGEEATYQPMTFHKGSQEWSEIEQFFTNCLKEQIPDSRSVPV